MKILDMCEAQRPREKLLRSGARSLGDAELLAILLRTGRRGESAIDMAHRLLSLVGGRLVGFAEADPAFLARLEGVGPSRASALLAALELGRRFVLEQSDRGSPLSDPAQIFTLMLPRLKGMKHEECWIILLDSHLRKLRTVQMTVGGRRETCIDVSQIIHCALRDNAWGLVLVHNHPNGDPRPSHGDIKETRRLRDACTACGLKLFDHIIISDEHFYSFDSEKMY